MSLVDYLNDETLWNDFLKSKQNSKNLPKKVIQEYEEYISTKKYKPIVQDLIKGDYQFSIPKKVFIGKMGKMKKRVVYIYEKNEIYIY